MTKTHDFELELEREVPELKTRARFYRHLKTGAELLSLQNDDENKVFNISFRTPPEDSTGVAHIMEHSVLGGSRKYRVKEPFVELVKGSLKTFVNAFTSPDKTNYPVASQNLKDFYNLIEVYLDAVFYPLITPYHLDQEGWHYELNNLEDPLSYKGVVFNEMKGAFSSPETMMYVYSKGSLFPDNTYGYVSGGDPKVIPDLTYEQFKRFHEKFYHPSNARIFFYGDDPEEERLRILNEYLRDFESIKVDSAVSLQRPFEESQKLAFPVAVDGRSGIDKKGRVQMNWALSEGNDPELVMGLSVLSYALVSSPASPLRKALVDSGLGEDITGGGLGTQLRQMTFAIGLKGMNVEDSDKVESLILKTLSLLAQDGFEADMIQAAVNSIEFSLRENNTGQFPRGIALMFRAMRTWLHGGDPIEPLAFEAPLTVVKNNLTNNPNYLQELICTNLLQNNHRVTVILKPDPELQQREETAEKEKLARIKSGMSQKDLQAIIDHTRELKRLQETPDDPDALAAIPVLTLADLDKENKLIPIAISESQGSQVLYHDLFTNGIVYLDIGFNLKSLPQELLPYTALFGRALLEMGTETEDFVKLSQRIGGKTGGIWPSILTAAVQNSKESVTYLLLRGKATVEQSQDFLSILHDVLLTVQLDDRERFRQILLKAKAGKESSLIPGGHGVINGRLRAKFNQADWAAEQINGIDNLFFLRDLIDEIDHDWPSVLADLEKIRQVLVNRNSMICNIILDEGNFHRFESHLNGFLSALPAAPIQLPEWKSGVEMVNEGLTIPAQVNYVAKGANLYDLGYELDGSISVITNLTRLNWLWEKIRAQGGAYGAYMMFGKNSGVLSFLSYRDPNLLGTLDNYDDTADFLRHLELSQEELVKGIIGAIGSMDAYQLPDSKGYTSMVRYLVGETDEIRQQYRNELLSTCVDDFKTFADVLNHVNEHGLVVVMGSPESIADANSKRNNWLKVSRVL